jgi:hypothetical protein
MNSKEYNKTYYEKNKVKTIAKQCILTECTECKAMVQNWNMSKHKKTKTHLLTKQLNELLKEKENLNIIEV